MSKERGFLTKTDRDFLTGEKEYTGENAKQQRYERREAIASRARRAFYDFAFLFEKLDKHERERVFGVSRDDHSDFRDALEDTLAFLYTASKDDVASIPSNDYLPMPSFRTLLDVGVSKAEAARHSKNISPTGHVDVTFSVDVNPPTVYDMDRLVDKIAQFKMHELSESEVRFALDEVLQDRQDFCENIDNRREELDLQEPEVLGFLEDGEIPDGRDEDTEE